MKNKIMLITYADSLGSNLQELNAVLEQHIKAAVSGVHILPFFPSSADRGFAPMTYETVDPIFGSWDDIAKLAEKHELMFDFMINHISRSSAYFKDFEEKGLASEWADLFIRYKDFWPNGAPTEQQVDLIYKRKPRAPSLDVSLPDGSVEAVWCTFDTEQVDLDLRKEKAKEFVRRALEFLATHGAAIIRLDAFAYAIKKPDTSCFFIEPEIWDLLDSCKDILSPLGVDILPEIHEHYTIQMKLAQKNHWIYDFALPMLLLHGLYTGKTASLKRWLKMCPDKQFTTLDTHDGIGVVDVRDLLTDDEIELTRESLFTQGANVKKIYNTAAYNNLDIYQINCTYYSALGNDDEAYLLARAIQFFAPGIPQVYYVGLLAGANDIELLERTKVGRDINRHAYSVDEVANEVQRPVVKRLFELMTFRNTYPAFDGPLEIVEDEPEGTLTMKRQYERNTAILTADLKSHTWKIHYTDENGEMVLL